MDKLRSQAHTTTKFTNDQKVEVQHLGGMMGVKIGDNWENFIEEPGLRVSLSNCAEMFSLEVGAIIDLQLSDGP